MHKETENIHIFFVVTEKEMIDCLFGFLKGAGITVKSPDSIDDMVRHVHDNPVVFLQPPECDSEKNTLVDFVNTIRNNTESVSCAVITADKLLHLMENLKNISRQHSRKNTNQKTLGEIEKEHITRTLDDNNWHYKTAAKLLGINRSTLYRKLKKYGLPKKN